MAAPASGVMGHLVARTESTSVVSGARMATGVTATSTAAVTVTESVESPSGRVVISGGWCRRNLTINFHCTLCILTKPDIAS